MNSSEKPPTISKVLFGLAKDHLELASLEWEYAKKKWWRHLFVWGGGVTFFISSYFFFQLFLIGALQKTGMSLSSIGLLLSIIYLALGIGCLFYLKNFRIRVGDPFEGSQDEVKRSFHWIENHFF